MKSGRPMVKDSPTKQVFENKFMLVGPYKKTIVVSAHMNTKLLNLNMTIVSFKIKKHLYC